MRISTKSDPSHDEVRLDLTKQELEERFLAPYREGRPMVIGGKTVQPYDLERIRINYTDETSRDLLPIVRAEQEASSVVAIGISDEWYVANRGRDVTDGLITSPLGIGALPSSQTDPEKTIAGLSTGIAELRKSCNDAARLQNLETVFKPTTKTEHIAAKLPLHVSHTERGFGEFIDMLYQLLYESAGNRLPQPIPEWDEAIDAIKGLRHYFFHDLEHGDRSKIGKKYKQVGSIYETLVGKKVPAQNDWVRLQIELLGRASSGLQKLLEVLRQQVTMNSKHLGKLELVKPTDVSVGSKGAGLSYRQARQYEAEDRQVAALVLYYIMCLFGVSWSVWWVFDPADAFGFAILTTVILGGATYGLGYFMLWEIETVVQKSKAWFPVIALGSCCFIVGSLALQYSLRVYPNMTGLAFNSHLNDSMLIAFRALIFVLASGVVLNLPVIAVMRKSKTGLKQNLFRWIRLNGPLFKKTIALAILIGILCANVGRIDSNLMLFTPRVGFVETRYLTDGVVHVYQVGLATFGAWSQNQKIVHIMMPLFPLVSETYYSFDTNSTRSPLLLSASGLAVSSPVEDSQDRIVVRLTTDSTSTSSAQFSVQFYSEFDINQLAHVYFSPRIFIQNFPNGTQQLQQQFSIVNYSAYELRLDRIVLYEGGYAPTNQTLNFSPLQSFPQPYFHYDNNTRTFAIYGSVYQYGNLIATVTYNSP